jgi:DNA-binding IclR family transcriptional regulator
LRTLDLALETLEAFSPERPEWGVTELAQSLGVSKATLYRILSTLKRRRYVVQDPVTRRYRYGPRLRQMNQEPVSKLNLVVEARGYLERLRDATRDTVHLAVLDGPEAVYIAKVDGLEPVQVVSTIGTRAPAHCVSTGKVLLAHAEPILLDRLLGGHIRGYTPLTRTTPDQLRAELQDVRRKGYAVNVGEWRLEVRGVAAPVMDAGSGVVAALGICGPASRMSDEHIAASIPVVVEMARELSAHLGG